MPFRNSVVGGTTLVRAAIRSPNFVTGVSGWSIDRDGSAEFNDIVIRGGTVIGGDALYYSGTPAFDNMLLSISAAGGTDPFGNVYPAGFKAYGSDPDDFVSISGDTLLVQSADGSFVEVDARGGTGNRAAILMQPPTVPNGNFLPASFEAGSIAIGSDEFPTLGIASPRQVGFAAAGFTLIGGDTSDTETAMNIAASVVSTAGRLTSIGGSLTTTGNDSASADDTTNRTTTSAAYTTLAGSVAVTIVCPESGIVMVAHHLRCQHTVANESSFQSVLVTSGGTLRGATDDASITKTISAISENDSGQHVQRLDLIALGASAGDSVTFTVQNRTTAATATFLDRSIDVWCLTQ